MGNSYTNSVNVRDALACYSNIYIEDIYVENASSTRIAYIGNTCIENIYARNTYIIGIINCSKIYLQ